jgi:excisionase family DNA binding protein
MSERLQRPKNETDMEVPLLLRIAQAQQLIGLGRTKTYELVEAGEIPSIRVGRSRLIRYSALIQWIQKKLTSESVQQR